MISQARAIEDSYMWILNALFGMVSFSLMFLLFKQMTRFGLEPAAVFSYVFPVASVFFLLFARYSGTNLQAVSPYWLLALLAGFCSFSGNLFSLRALSGAPNPGYAVTLVSLNVVVVTLVSVALFGSELSYLKGLGVVLCVIGGLLVAL